jgi:hypothetical protein
VSKLNCVSTNQRIYPRKPLNQTENNDNFPIIFIFDDFQTKPVNITINQQQKATKQFGESHFNHAATANTQFFIIIGLIFNF